jgi:hypothetical protein
MILSIDPGKRHIAYAVMDGGQLRNAAMTDPVEAYEGAFLLSEVIRLFLASLKINGIDQDAVSVVLCEFPRTYPHQRTPPNDLFPLAAIAGAITTLFSCNTYFIEPRVWKGNIPKAVMTQRIKDSLTPPERARINLPSQKSLQHNVFDAIGIGLWHMSNPSKLIRR